MRAFNNRSACRRTATTPSADRAGKGMLAKPACQLPQIGIAMGLVKRLVHGSFSQGQRVHFPSAYHRSLTYRYSSAMHRTSKEASDGELTKDILATALVIDRVFWTDQVELPKGCKRREYSLIKFCECRRWSLPYLRISPRKEVDCDLAS